MNRDKKWVRYTATTVRILLALIFILSGISYFFTPEATIIGDAASVSGKFMTALLGTGYFLPVLKIIELVSGLIMLFSKRLTAFALILLSPIIIHIFLYSLFLYQSIIIAPIVLGIFAIFLAWYNWAKYAPLFRK